jgi:preprotein translocase subunit SecY
MFATIKKAFSIPDVRKKILITLFLISVYRLIAHIPVPGIDRQSLNQLFTSNELLGLIDIFQGGSLSRFSVATVGLSPYITASIILQMLTFTIPQLEELTKEGAYGAEKINRYTKLLTVPIALIQSFGIYMLFLRQGLFPNIPVIEIAVILLTLVAGSMIIMWLGDLITEHNIGNGISILILAGILAELPTSFQSLFLSLQSGGALGVGLAAAVALVVISGVIFVNEAIRKIPVTYASSSARGSQSSNFIPLKLNQAGVIPIIFAVSLVLIPSAIGNFLQQVPNSAVQNIAIFFATNFNPNAFLYNATYFVLVVFFTFFYTAINNIPHKITEDLKNRGGFIPGIRPGKATEDYLNKVLTRITFVGALFLGFVAILPSIASGLTGITSISIGGTGILIVVSVILETMKKIESQVIMHEYEKIALY